MVAQYSRYGGGKSKAGSSTTSSSRTTARKTLVELYVRNDISCGSSLCGSGCAIRDGLRSDVIRYVVPRREYIEKYLDCFEQSGFDEDGLILLKSQLDGIGTGKIRLLSRIRALYRDKRRNVYMFDDVHHAALQHIGGRCKHREKMVAQWYEEHLDNKVVCVPLDSDESVHSYFTDRWKNSEVIMNLYETQLAAEESTKKHCARLSPEEIEHGLAIGKYVRGTFSVDVFHSSSLARIVGENNATVFVFGREDRWHAVHGDEVVGELCENRDTAIDEDRNVEDGDDLHGLVEMTDESVSSTGEPEQKSAARVVAVLQRKQQDLLVTISNQDVEALAHAQNVTSVMCIPFDYRFPKMRLRSRFLEKYVGKRLVVRMTGWDDNSMYPEVHVIKVVGPLGDLKTETDSILYRYDLMLGEFSKASLAELPQKSGANQGSFEISEELAHHEINTSGRRDLRSEFVVSIDPPGCTDVDDAFHVKELDGDLFELGIHIADVTYFVRSGSLLDEEAAARSTTVYLVDERLNMLPSEISEDAASLLCGKTRFAVSVIWKISKKTFQVVDTWFGRTLIQSRYQLEYSEAQAALDGSNDPFACGTKHSKEDLKQLKQSLDLARKLAWKRLRLRKSAGAIELDSKEIKFITDEHGMPISIHEKPPMDATKLIAELMIMANEAVAKQIHESYPNDALLRYHTCPDAHKLDQIREFYDKMIRAKIHHNDANASEQQPFTVVQHFGLDLQQAFKAIHNYPGMDTLLQSAANRSLSEAKYAPAGSISNHTHFGLAIDFYTHFTSPIRRYADIIVHRQLLQSLKKTGDNNTLAWGRDLSGKVAIMNERNRASKLAQRECSMLYMLQYLSTSPRIEKAIVQDIEKDKVFLFIPSLELRGRAVIPQPHVSFSTMDAVHVLLETTESSFHGPSLHITILPEDDDRIKCLLKDENLRKTRAAASPHEDDEDDVQHEEQEETHVPPLDVVNTTVYTLEDATSLLQYLSISKTKQREWSATASYAIQKSNRCRHGLLDSEHGHAITLLLDKARTYATRASRYHKGSEKHSHWTSKSMESATHAETLMKSLYNL